MADDVGAIDPFAATNARAEFDDVSERRAARVAGAADDGPTNVEVARLIGRVLCLAAEKLDIPFNWQDGILRDLCRQLVAASQRNGRLSPIEYRIAFWLVSDARSPF